jgi:hypothetical protein
MSADPIEQILGRLDRPVQPRSEFADPLLHDLLDVLASEAAPFPAARTRWRWGRRATALVAAFQRRPLRATAALAATLLLVVILNLGAAYLAPTFALALANAPILGSVARPVLDFSGLDPNQVIALDESAISSGHTIRLIGAFADSERTVLIIEIDGQHPVPNKKQSCCLPYAYLTDQFGHTYSWEPSVDALTLTFDPLVAPASQVGARLTLHVTALQTFQQADNVVPPLIYGDWKLHLTLFQHAKALVRLPSPGSANGVIYRFTSIRLSGLQLAVDFTMTGPPVDQVEHQLGNQYEAQDQLFVDRYATARLVDTAGNSAAFACGVSFGLGQQGPVEGHCAGELPEPDRYTLTLGGAPGALMVEIDIP